MTRFLTLAAGFDLYKRLKSVLCSMNWVDALLQPVANGRGWKFTNSEYPPANSRSPMQRCAWCHHISPPNGAKSVCCDCEIEIDEWLFQNRVLESLCHEEEYELQKRWWWAPTTYLELHAAGVLPWCEPHTLGDDRYAASDRDLDETVEWSATGEARSVESREMRRWQRKVAHHRLGLPASPFQYCDPIPRSSLSQLPDAVADQIFEIVSEHDRTTAKSTKSFSTAIRRACQPLGEFQVTSQTNSVMLIHDAQKYLLIRRLREFSTRNVSSGTGRAAGCQISLLSEQEDRLLSEIDSYQKQGKIVPSAKRFTRCNPYLKAPEDRQSVAACFVSRRRGGSPCCSVGCGS